MKLAIIGACGKMGSGIAELFLQKDIEQLVCIDTHAFPRDRFRKSLRTFAEKNINRLRERSDLVSNQEVIDAYIEQQFDKTIFTTVLEEAKHAEWVFEAIFEDVDQKVQLFNALKKIVSKYTLFFSNTSAIPIHELVKKTDLQNRLIGFHFYNPPTVNKMLEIVVDEPLKPIAESLATELNRTYVFSGDVPGFIGNGHFIRELKFILDLNMPSEEIDRICEEELLRPFGPFKLAQFIGIPTVLAIGKVMGIDLSKLTSYPKTSSKKVESQIAERILQNSKEIEKLLVEIGAAPDLKSVETVLKVGFKYGIL